MAAMGSENEYLWGGTVGPDYDCSGLIQHAFSSNGIWIPRDAWQQEAFTEPVARECIQPGDLVFFGETKAKHVGLCVQTSNVFLEGASYAALACHYIHSSGLDEGHDGIAVDQLYQVKSYSPYQQQVFRGAGRVVRSVHQHLLPV